MYFRELLNETSENLVKYLGFWKSYEDFEKELKDYFKDNNINKATKDNVVGFFNQYEQKDDNDSTITRVDGKWNKFKSFVLLKYPAGKIVK